jgi:lipopolysaccharide transport system ATP-binding protein
MSDLAVVAEGLGKRYRISHQRDAYPRLSEALTNALRAPFDLVRGRRRDTTEWFWALRDVSFELRHGDIVGVIGRNGAGKSTLLKILSRITEPTTGHAEVYGRVGSLLEVGTGFHPELTGRENIQMSAAVLGMRRSEIERKFDEIVDFAGIGPFLDTPVKRYSSGMQVRLGFAVAAHLEHEILFIDEVLAVGDAEFQKKCLGKISEIGQAGRTIVFVSHSMPALLRLCDRAMLLDQGRVVAHGPTQEVVQTYLESDLGRTWERRWEDDARAPGDDVARLRSIRVLPGLGGRSDEVDITEPVDVEVLYLSTAPGTLRPSVNLHFYNDEGICLFVTNDWTDRAWWERERPSGIVRCVCRIPGNFLAEGRVTVTAAVSTYNPTVVHALERDAVAFQVVEHGDSDGVRGVYGGDWPGVVRPMLEWHVNLVQPGDQVPSRPAITDRVPKTAE